MKNIKTFGDQPFPDDEVVLYSFLPFFDDEFKELSESRKTTTIRLMKWMLQTLNITPEEFLKQVKADEPPKQ
jgi:hypothetical protein